MSKKDKLNFNILKYKQVCGFDKIYTTSLFKVLSKNKKPHEKYSIDSSHLKKCLTLTKCSLPKRSSSVSPGDGSYAWSVGSGKEPLSYSKLVSPVYETGNSNECLLFWYCMHGPDVQTFDVNVVEKGSGKRTTVWSREGDQGVGWRKVGFVLIETCLLNLVFVQKN